MWVPLFFPVPSIVEHVDRASALPLRALLTRAGATVRASGVWIERPVVLCVGPPQIQREPGDWGCVRIWSRYAPDTVEAARYGSLAMAYAIMDVVARESVRGEDWARPKPPPGRQKQRKPLSNAERQRRFRERRAEG